MRIFRRLGDRDALPHLPLAPQIWLSHDPSRHCSWLGRSDWPLYPATEGTLAPSHRSQRSWTHRLELCQEAIVLGLLHLERTPRIGLLLPIALSPFLRDFPRPPVGARCPAPGSPQHFPSPRPVHLWLSLRHPNPADYPHNDVDCHLSSRLSSSLGRGALLAPSRAVRLHLWILWRGIHGHVGEDGQRGH